MGVDEQWLLLRQPRLQLLGHEAKLFEACLAKSAMQRPKLNRLDACGRCAAEFAADEYRLELVEALVRVLDEAFGRREHLVREDEELPRHLRVLMTTALRAR